MGFLVRLCGLLLCFVLLKLCCNLYSSIKRRREREEVMKTAGAFAGMALAGLGLAMLASSSSSGSEQKGSKKLMKAPGAGGDSYIYRDDFERNPDGYFRNNRLKE
ncbi:hypothetical protein LOK49_LG01G00188 [Camellia lanceoleosa]|uniref:Uncharacterized protein n=1 Tax=Camellia lanceoleosa TaxID=1840588 RepID=A0ACC0J011_9ERIC|nr:hypothetical protein LOK49_LG01G00188 [Camellia lanceoleosa]